jgi:hypothetical protein
MIQKIFEGGFKTTYGPVYTLEIERISKLFIAQFSAPHGYLYPEPTIAGTKQDILNTIKNSIGNNEAAIGCGSQNYDQRMQSYKLLDLLTNAYNTLEQYAYEEDVSWDMLWV